MTESVPKKPNYIAEISPHLICALCGGYLIDATTIVECLHSFCKTCIVRYLESSKYCPICEVLVHKTRPLQNIRLDQTLQNIVYKLVPGLFQSEMKRRREFYKDSPTVSSEKIRLEQRGDRFIYSADEQFSISLEFSHDGRVQKPSGSGRRLRRLSKPRGPDRHFLLCPAGFTVAYLKKYMRLKFDLPPNLTIDIFHGDGPLLDHFSLMDIAYIYSWKREGVLQLHYSVYKLPEPSPQITITEIKQESNTQLPYDSILKAEDTRPSSLFSKASLLGNHSMDGNLHHDLSPLELIATVANDISCLQEGRGLKRKSEHSHSPLYEQEDDNSSTETQIKQTIERAIDLCSTGASNASGKQRRTHSPLTTNSNSNSKTPQQHNQRISLPSTSNKNGAPTVSVSSSTFLSPSSHACAASTTTTVINHDTNISKSISNQSASHSKTVVSKSQSTGVRSSTPPVKRPHNNIDTSTSVPSTVSSNTSKPDVGVKQKPKKTDTGSQCEPRPKKPKTADSNSRRQTQTPHSSSRSQTKPNTTKVNNKVSTKDAKGRDNEKPVTASANDKKIAESSVASSKEGNVNIPAKRDNTSSSKTNANAKLTPIGSSKSIPSSTSDTSKVTASDSKKVAESKPKTAAGSDRNLFENIAEKVADKTLDPVEKNGDHSNANKKTGPGCSSSTGDINALKKLEKSCERIISKREGTPTKKFEKGGDSNINSASRKSDKNDKVAGANISSNTGKRTEKNGNSDSSVNKQNKHEVTLGVETNTNQNQRNDTKLDANKRSDANANIEVKVATTESSIQLTEKCTNSSIKATMAAKDMVKVVGVGSQINGHSSPSEISRHQKQPVVASSPAAHPKPSSNEVSRQPKQQITSGSNPK